MVTDLNPESLNPNPRPPDPDLLVGLPNCEAHAVQASALHYVCCETLHYRYS